MQLKLFTFIFCFQLSLCEQGSAWNGQNYDKNSSLQYRVGLKAIESFSLRGNEKVLDVGCGNGKITAECAQRLTSGSLLAIDSSPSMIDFAQQHYGTIQNLQFVLQDVTTMSFDQEFDFVYSIFCLHWVKDIECALRNIVKSLKPFGKAILYISIPNEFNQAFHKEFYSLLSSPRWSPYKNVLTFGYYPVAQELLLEYAQHNNVSANFTTIHDTVVFDSYQAFKQRLTAYGVCYEIIQVLGNELGNTFVDSYLENIYKRLGLSSINEPITWQSDAIILTLIKNFD